MVVAIAALALLVAGPPPPTLPPPGRAGSHEAYLRQVQSAERRALQQALAAYDAHLRGHPGDVTAAIERCKLIAAEAAIHEEDDEPPGGAGTPTHHGCLEALARAFPTSAPAVRYRLDFKWSNDAIAFAKEALANPKIAWTDGDRAHLYMKLARAYSLAHQLALAGQSARRAMDLAPELDLTRDVASELIEEGRRTEAVAVLSSRTDGPVYELAQKARMLADAGAFARGAWMLDLAAKKGKAAVDGMLRARLLERTGKLQLAREAYAQQKQRNGFEAATRIFEIDLAGNDRARAAGSYHELRDQGWKTDPLGRRRFALSCKFPLASWRASDLTGVLAFLGFIAGLVLLPALLLAPLYSWSLRRRFRTPQEQAPAAEGQWGFRDAWLATAAIFVCQFLAIYIFAYGDLGSLFGASDQQISPRSLGAFGLSYALLLSAFLAALLLRRRERLRLLGPGTWSWPGCLGRALLGLVITFAAGVVSHLVFKLPGKVPLAPGASAIESVVRGTVVAYGAGVALLVFAVLIPIAEELIFRSIILDVLARETRFSVANASQALLFAALHGDPPRLIFYFVFGWVTGRLRRASGGLLPGILMHAANNAIAVSVLAAVATSSLPRKVPAPAPDPELAACASSSSNSQLRALAGKVSAGNPSPMSVNEVAWSLAIEPSTSRACLMKAERAMEVPLRWWPELASTIDTKATLLYRQGRLDEAVELERGASALDGNPVLFSQLDRFLRARQARSGPLFLGGATSSPKVSFEPGNASAGRSIAVDTGDAYEDGLEIYARIVGSGGELALIQVAAGALHPSSYRFRVPRRVIDLPDDARLEIALVDARGCDSCSGGAWRWRLERHDKVVDYYP